MMSRKRIKHWAIQVVIAIALVAAVYCANNWYNREKLQRSTAQTDTGTISNFKQFHWTQSRASILIPEPRKFRKDTISSPFGEAELHTCAAEGSPLDLSLAYFDYPRAAVESYSDDERFELSVNAYEAKLGGQMVERQRISVHGNPGVEYTIQYAHLKPADFARKRFIVSGQRVYLISAVSWKGRSLLRSESANAFFDSFRLSDGN